MSMYKVFVYGTLKKGEPNHGLLSNPKNGHAKALGKARTVETYPLIIGTKYNIPFLLGAPGKGNIISGEVYEVDDLMMEKLDELEGHPDYYKRSIEHVVLTNSFGEDVPTECWIYILKSFSADLLDRTQYTCYSSAGEHGLPYVERSQRDNNHTSERKKL